MGTSKLNRRALLGALSLTPVVGVAITARATLPRQGAWTEAYRLQKAAWTAAAEADDRHVALRWANDPAADGAKRENERLLREAMSSLKAAIATPAATLAEAADKIAWGIEDGCCDDEIVAAALRDLRRLIAEA